MNAQIAIAAILALVIGGGLVWLLLRSSIGRLGAERDAARKETDQTRQAEERLLAKHQELEARLLRAESDLGAARSTAERVPSLERSLSEARSEITALTAAKAAVETEIAAQRTAHEEKVASLVAIRGEIDKELKALAGEALKSNQTSFLEVANQLLKQHGQQVATEDEKRQAAISALLHPISEVLVRYQTDLKQVEESRQTTYGTIAAELRNVIETQNAVRLETSKLVNALRASPKTRGRWGEHQLHNVMELSGMTAHVDFIPEPTFDGESGRLRPDAIIRLPGKRYVVVDAKTSMAAYLDAVDAMDGDEREAHLVRHAGQFRTHMKLLASKAYWDGLSVTPDFVAMFVPGDNFFAAAMERDPELFEDAIVNRVLIVTPTTLIALAKAIAFGWRQEKIAENARHVAELGRDLYRRLQVMGDHVLKLGGCLAAAVTGYNGFVGSLEGSVMPQARRFNELEVEGTAEALLILEPVETEVREPRRDRDLIFPAPATS